MIWEKIIFSGCARNQHFDDVRSNFSGITPSMRFFGNTVLSTVGCPWAPMGRQGCAEMNCPNTGGVVLNCQGFLIFYVRRFQWWISRRTGVILMFQLQGSGKTCSFYPFWWWLLSKKSCEFVSEGAVVIGKCVIFYCLFVINRYFSRPLKLKCYQKVGCGYVHGLHF